MTTNALIFTEESLAEHDKHIRADERKKVLKDLFASDKSKTLKELMATAKQDAIKEYHDRLSKEMHDLWRFYKTDINNRPKPTFMSAYIIVDLIAEQMKGDTDNE